MSPDFTFINRWGRVKCKGCGRTLMQGERGHAAFAHEPARPHSPIWCDGCYATETEARS